MILAILAVILPRWYAQPETSLAARHPTVPQARGRGAGRCPATTRSSTPGSWSHDGTYHLFARGVRDGLPARTPARDRASWTTSRTSWCSTSTDGLSYYFAYVLATSGRRDGDQVLEDPRVQVVRSDGDEHVVMTYTNLPPDVDGTPWRIGVHRLEYATGGALPAGRGQRAPHRARRHRRTRTRCCSTWPTGGSRCCTASTPTSRWRSSTRSTRCWRRRRRVLGRPPGGARAPHDHLAVTGRVTRGRRRAAHPDRGRLHPLLPRASRRTARTP